MLLLYQNQLTYSESLEFFMNKPMKYLKQLSIDELRDLLEEANVYFFKKIFCILIFFLYIKKKQKAFKKSTKF